VVAGLPSVIGGQEKTPHELDLVRRRARSLMFTDVRLSQNRAQDSHKTPGKSTRFYNQATGPSPISRLRGTPNSLSLFG